MKFRKEFIVIEKLFKSPSKIDFHYSTWNTSETRPIEVKLRYVFLRHQILAVASYLDNKVQKGVSVRTKFSSLYFKIQD
jgi:hypothetical protein